MDKKLKKLIKQRHALIKDNQDVKRCVLIALTQDIDESIKTIQSNEIKRLKSVLWEREQICKQNNVKVNRNKKN